MDNILVAGCVMVYYSDATWLVKIYLGEFGVHLFS